MIFILLYQIFTGGFFAWLNYFLISKKMKIYHWLNGLLHVSVSVAIWYYTKEWNYAASNLLFTRVVFDTVLNIWRSKGVGYVSSDPDSVLDQAEKWLILRIAAIVHKKRIVITDHQIQWVAIYFRLFILSLAIIFLFI